MRPVYLFSSAVCGALAATGWPPLGWWPLALTGFAALFWLVGRATSVGSAAVTGLCFGLALHLAGHGWIYDTLHAKAGLGAPAAGASTLLYLAYLAAFTALPCAAFHAVVVRSAGAQPAPAGWASAAAFAGCLALGEWARSLFFNGFSSLSLGYALIDTWFAGYAALAGLYGVSLAALLLAALVMLAVASRIGKASAAAGIVALLLGGGLLGRIAWVQPSGPTLSYRLIQVATPHARQRDRADAQRAADALIAEIVRAPADLVATPETALPLPLRDLPIDAIPRLQAFAAASASNVFLGVLTTAANADGHNSILQIAPNTASGAMAQYDKVRLMPFGEYAPPGFAWFSRALTVSRKNMSAGAERQPPFEAARPGVVQRVGVLICQEDQSGRYAGLQAGISQLLLNPTNLSWFDGERPVEQGLGIARMRALEVGRPILRVSTTGVTAHIDPDGRIVRRLPASADGVLGGTVQPVDGRTPYAVTGNGPAVALCCLFVLVAGVRRRRFADLAAQPR